MRFNPEVAHDRTIYYSAFVITLLITVSDIRISKFNRFINSILWVVVAKRYICYGHVQHR